MPVWTVIADYDGGTYLSQSNRDTLFGALKDFSTSGCKSLPTAIDFDEEFFKATAIDGLQNVWCTSTMSNDGELLLLHLIETVSRDEHGTRVRKQPIS